MKQLILITFLMILACDSRQIRNTKEIKSTQLELMNNKDITAYVKLHNYYEDDSSYYNMLPYSLYMLKKSNIGHYDFFCNYLRISFDGKYQPKDILKLDEPEKNFLIYILQLGSMKEDFYCIKVLSDYYRNGIVVKKDIRVADSLYQKLGYAKSDY